MARYSYDAFGKLIAKAGRRSGFFRHRFSTKYFDSETGLYYYGYRFYHPGLMRWLNRDPIGESEIGSLYTFALNSGINYCDKLGLFTVFPVADSPRLSSGSDFWFAVYFEFDKSEADKVLVVNRRIEMSFCLCETGKREPVKVSDIISDVYINKNLSTSQEYKFSIAPSSQVGTALYNSSPYRTYLELLSLPKYGPQRRGSIDIHINFTILGQAQYSALRKTESSSSLFGSHDRKHGLTVYSSEDVKKISFPTSYRATLIYGCGNEFPDLTEKKTGNWKYSTNDRMYGNKTRQQMEMEDGKISFPYNYPLLSHS
jgi:RHS repeat-associated protein